MNFSYLPIIALVSWLAGSYYLGYIPPIIFLIIIVASLLTFLIYAKDKKAAKNNKWRTPESTLHLCSLFCGWPGAIIAQQKLRHKSKKMNFRVVFVLTVLINIAAISALHTNNGSQILRNSTSELGRLISQNVTNQRINGTVLFLFSYREMKFNPWGNPEFYIRKSKK